MGRRTIASSRRMGHGARLLPFLQRCAGGSFPSRAPLVSMRRDGRAPERTRWTMAGNDVKATEAAEKETLLARAALRFTAFTEKWLPDAFGFVLVGTFIVFAL